LTDTKENLVTTGVIDPTKASAPRSRLRPRSSWPALAAIWRTGACGRRLSA